MTLILPMITFIICILVLLSAGIYLLIKSQTINGSNNLKYGVGLILVSVYLANGLVNNDTKNLKIDPSMIQGQESTQETQ